MGNHMNEVDYYLGLDLGQTTDYTALAVVERTLREDRKEDSYAVRLLQRFALGTAYTDIVPAVVSLAVRPPLAGNVTLVVDQTGVGRAVVDMLRRTPGAPWSVPVTITGGHTVTEKEGGG
jgi:hypothetical protein